MKKIIYGFLATFLMIGFVSVSYVRAEDEPAGEEAALGDGSTSDSGTPVAETNDNGGGSQTTSGPQTPDTTQTLDRKKLEKEMRKLVSKEDSAAKSRANTSGAVKGALIGTGVGLAAGGLATGITAWIESTNISCQVGNDMKDFQTGFGKSRTIPTLKKFYVDWALNLPDIVLAVPSASQAFVSSCTDWDTACTNVKPISYCTKAAINYKPATSNSFEQIPMACKLSGASCVKDATLAMTHNCP